MVGGVDRMAFASRLGDAKALLIGWALAEVVALVLAIKLIGFGGVVLLSIGSSLLGVVMLRRVGLGAARGLRVVATTGAAPEGALADGMLAALGALLLILPGLVSDAVGLALAAPSTRQLILARLGGLVRPVGARPRASRARDVIDLSPADWRVVDRSEPR